MDGGFEPLPQGMEDYLAENGEKDPGLREHLQKVVAGGAKPQPSHASTQQMTDQGTTHSANYDAPSFQDENPQHAHLSDRFRKVLKRGAVANHIDDLYTGDKGDASVKEKLGPHHKLLEDAIKSLPDYEADPEKKSPWSASKWKSHIETIRKIIGPEAADSIQSWYDTKGGGD